MRYDSWTLTIRIAYRKLLTTMIKTLPCTSSDRIPTSIRTTSLTSKPNLINTWTQRK